MQVVIKSQYVCSICGKVSTDKAKIEACEAKHKYLATDCPVVANYHKGEVAPYSLDVAMTDGSVWRYSCGRKIASPPEPAEEVGDAQ